MSDELRKLRESIKRQKAIIETIKILAETEIEAPSEPAQTETGERDRSGELPQSE